MTSTTSGWVFDSPSAPGNAFTHAIGASMNLLPPSQFDVRAQHIARTMTIEVRMLVPHGSVFHIAEAWIGSAKLVLTP